MADLNIGLRQARRLAEMSFQERLGFIAEGLPIIRDSARSLLAASKALPGRERETDILRGFSEEEAAKALILLDIVRCPPKLVAQKVGTLIRWFYDHLARLIYAEACHMRPVTTTMLQKYVDSDRKAHYLEGDYGEYILPNTQLFKRESKLYADVAAYEDQKLFWNVPTAESFLISRLDPSSYEVVEALSALGALSAGGVAVVAEVWGGIEFRDDVGAQESDRLIQETVARLVAKGLPREDAEQRHVSTLYGRWQFPMYNLDLRKIEVTMEELSAERDKHLPY